MVSTYIDAQEIDKIKLLCKYLTSGSNAPYVLGYLVGVREYV